MCVLYIAENGNRNDLRIDYCIENLIYNIREGEVLANLSLFLTNESSEYQALKLLHLKTVADVKALNLENHSDYVFLQQVRDIYKGRILFNLSEKTVEFYCKPRELANDKDLLKANIQKLQIDTEYPNRSERNTSRKYEIPYTSIRIAQLPPCQTIFYSINITVKNNNFDYLIGGIESPSINGTVRELKNYSNDWKLFFDIPEDKILKPLRHDILIQNKYGLRHPKCYRLDSNIYPEYIKDKKLASKVAWFSSPDPQEDFSIEVLFPEKENRLVTGNV